MRPDAAWHLGTAKRKRKTPGENVNGAPVRKDEDDAPVKRVHLFLCPG
jgi:hypothetical protein